MDTATISRDPRATSVKAESIGGENPTVGKFMGLLSGKAVIIGLVTEIGEQLFPSKFR